MYRSGQSVAVTSRMDVQLNNKSVSHKSSTLTVGAPLNPGTPLSVASPLSVGSPLCEDGRAYVTDPVTGRQMCMCSLGVGNDVHFPHLNMGHEARKQGALSASGGSPHCLGFDTSAFCSPVIRGLPMRPDRMPPYLTTGIPGHSMSFDPALAGHPYGLLYQGMDMNGPMRKAATRETTGPLKAWLSEHKKNPYPTKAEKIMLAIITRMTLTQVSTWFANARRRLKKENKLYPGDRESRPDDDYDDEDDDMDSQKDGSGPHRSGSDKVGGTSSDNEDINVDDSDEIVDDDAELILDKSSVRGFDPRYLYSQGPGRHLWPSSGSDISTTEDSTSVKDAGSDRSSRNRSFDGPCAPGAESSKNSSSSKPKIWSISEIIGTSEPKQTSAASQAPPAVYGSKPIPPLVISSPFMHLSSSHMNPSPLLSTFTSSLASSHRFHHQLAGMSGLFFPVNDPQLTLVPPGFAADDRDYSDRRLYNDASPVDKPSPPDSRYAMHCKKELSDTLNGLEHSKTHKGGSSNTPETPASKFEDSFGKTDLSSKGISVAKNSELISPHSSKSNRKPISPDGTPPHTPGLSQERSSNRASPERHEMNTVTNRIFNSPQKNTAVKSERSRHGENALNLQKAKTSEN